MPFTERTPSPPSGWLPVDITFDQRPAVVPDAAVRWLEFGSAALEEPFFEHTVERLRNSKPAGREVETDIDTMLRIAERLPAVQPAGFVCHISRCGSTLIANGLKTARGVEVVSESRALTHVLRPYPHASEYLKVRWNRSRKAMAEALFSLFAHYRTTESRKLAVKFASINILSLPLIRACWPEVPCVVVVRDPVEVLDSSLRGGGWMTLKDVPDVAMDLFGWKDLPRSTQEMTREEFAARVVGTYLESGLQAIRDYGGDKCKVVDYQQLSPQKVRQIGEFFGLELPGSEELNRVFQVYAKDPKREHKFQDDRPRKQQAATALTRGAANTWAMDAYTEIRRRSAW